MKYLGNIFLVWRKGKGSRRIVVGILKRNISNGVSFNYLSEGVAEAVKLGFTPYEGFPDLRKKYVDNVAEIFGQRIVKSERSDIANFYTFWKVVDRFKNDDYYMLAYTQGILPTDNFEFLADFNPSKGLNFVTEIAGLSKSQIDSKALEVNDVLTYKRDENNAKDKYAIEVYKNEILLGYIKKIHSRVLFRSKSKFLLKVQHIEKNGVLSRVFLEASL